LEPELLSPQPAGKKARVASRAQNNSFKLICFIIFSLNNGGWLKKLFNLISTVVLKLFLGGKIGKRLKKLF
jgi:hypothetical protein